MAATAARNVCLDAASLAKTRLTVVKNAGAAIITKDPCWYREESDYYAAAGPKGEYHCIVEKLGLCLKR